MSVIDQLQVGDKKIGQDVDLLTALAGLGEVSTAAHNNIFGLDHLGTGTSLPYNTDNRGLVFFTRPRLNLSDANLSVDRVFTRLMTKSSKTYQMAIRDILDPIGAITRAINSPLVDSQQAFIPLLSNNLTSLTGWPDPQMNIYSSQEGLQKEAWAMADDVFDVNGNFTLNANFRNINGDPITLLIFFWIRYMARVYSGVFSPLVDSVVQNEIDYQTRIYRFVLDPSRQFIQKMAATRASFPVASSLAQAFNYSSDAPLIEDQATQVQVPFQCSMGADYMDPITFEEFNFIVQVYNPNMRDERRGSKMKALSMRESALFKHYAYPRIDSYTGRIEWWVRNEDYARLMNINLTSSRAADPIPTGDTP